MSTLREQMIEELMLRGMSERTREVYIWHVASLARHFKLPPDQIEAEQIREFFVDQSQRLQPQTLSVCHAALRFLYAHVLKRPGMLDNVPRPKTKRRSRLPVVLSPDEIRQLLAATKKVRNRAMIMLMYGAGLRVSEVVGLRAGDIDSQRGVIYIRESKGDCSRVVMLEDSLLRTLRDWWKARPVIEGNDFLFPGSKGREMLTTSNVGKMVRTAAKRAGLTKRVHPHSLRHSFAVEMLERGVDIRRLQVLLGHASIETTALYLNLSVGHIAKTPSPLRGLLADDR